MTPTKILLCYNNHKDFYVNNNCIRGWVFANNFPLPDQISIEELDVIYKIPHCVPISAHHRWNFDDLLEKMWEYLKLIRIYTKPKGQLPDYNSPVVLHADRTTVEDFCNKLHRSIVKEFKM